jgi:hypothetical protein
MTTAKPAGIPRHKTDAYIDYVIYLLLCCYLIVDSITGFLILTYEISISTYFKAFLALLMFLIIGAKSHKYFCFILFYIVLICLCALVYQNKEYIDFSQSLTGLIKLITIQIFYFYFCSMIQKNYEIKNIRNVNNIFKINIFIFLINILLGLLGFGMKTYSFREYGVKGFLYAGNEVAVLLYCLYFYCLLNIKYKARRMFVIYIFAMAISILVGTKTGVLSCFLISCVDFYYRLSRRASFYFRLFSPVIIAIMIYIISLILPLFEFYRFFASRIESLYKNENLLDIILSGRLKQFQNGYAFWREHISPSAFLFGVGNSYEKNSIEIDLFYTFFCFGLLISILTLVFYFYLIYASIKQKNKQLAYFNIIYFFISITAGHVWFSVMACMFFSYINAYELSRKK